MPRHYGDAVPLDGVAEHGARRGSAAERLDDLHQGGRELRRRHPGGVLAEAGEHPGCPVVDRVEIDRGWVAVDPGDQGGGVHVVPGAAVLADDGEPVTGRQGADQGPRPAEGVFEGVPQDGRRDAVVGNEVGETEPGEPGPSPDGGIRSGSARRAARAAAARTSSLACTPCSTHR